MRNLRSYDSWLNESAATKLIDEVLSKIEPTIERMLEQTRAWYKEKFEQDMTEYDEKMYRLTITYNLIRSFEIYALPTDTLQSLTSSGAANGTITLYATIQRGETTYPFETDVIYAGGYNIQRLHYRYITKTKLPREGKELIAKEYSDKIKKLSKAEKLNAEILSIEARIKANTDRAQNASSLTDDQILDIRKKEKNWFDAPPWEEIVKRGADKNYDYDEEAYYKSQEEYQRSTMDSWKRQNIQWPIENNKALDKQLTKLKAKLHTLI
jgi:hypothetical protein